MLPVYLHDSINQSFVSSQPLIYELIVSLNFLSCSKLSLISWLLKGNWKWTSSEKNLIANFL